MPPIQLIDSHANILSSIEKTADLQKKCDHSTHIFTWTRDSLSIGNLRKIKC